MILLYNVGSHRVIHSKTVKDDAAIQYEVEMPSIPIVSHRVSNVVELCKVLGIKPSSSARKSLPSVESRCDIDRGH